MTRPPGYEGFTQPDQGKSFEQEWVASFGPDFMLALIELAKRVERLDPKNQAIWNSGDFEIAVDTAHNAPFNARFSITAGDGQRLFVEIGHSSKHVSPKANPDLILKLFKAIIEDGMIKKPEPMHILMDFKNAIASLKKSGVRAIVLSGPGQIKRKQVDL